MIQRKITFNITSKLFVFLFTFLFLFSLTYMCYGSESYSGKSFINKEDNWYKLQASYELGFLDVLSHTIQFGSTGSLFNYVDEGGQDVLFPFSRITAEINLSKKHNLIFLIHH